MCNKLRNLYCGRADFIITGKGAEEGREEEELLNFQLSMAAAASLARHDDVQENFGGSVDGIIACGPRVGWMARWLATE